MIYKKKKYSDDVLLAKVVKVVEDNGFYVPIKRFHEAYPESTEYFWRKAIHHLSRKGLVTATWGNKVNLVESKFTERQWGFIDGYLCNKGGN